MESFKKKYKLFTYEIFINGLHSVVANNSNERRKFKEKL